MKKQKKRKKNVITNENRKEKWQFPLFRYFIILLFFFFSYILQASLKINCVAFWANDLALRNY